MPVQAGQAFIDVVPNLAQFDRLLQQQVRQRSRSFAKTFQSAGRELTNVGRTLTRRLTLPIAAVGAASFKAATDFESAFAGVRKTVDATEPEFARLRKGILDMSKQLPAAATEIAGVAEAAGQLGIRTPNILGFTRTMIDLGESTNLSASEAATALARLANITQLPQDQFDRLGATIVALGNNLATTEREIVEMGLRIAGAGEQIGLSEAQVLAFAGALSSVGIEAEAGGTAISRVFVDIANASAKGGKKLEGFAKVAGVSAKEFQQRFKRDAAGAVISFVEGLDKIARGGGNVFATLEELGLSNVRVRDTLLRAAGAGELLRESLVLGADAWEENTALTKEANQRYKTTASQLKIARNQVIATGIAIGEKLAPLVIRASKAVQGLVEGFQNLSPAAQRMIGIGALVGLGLGPGLRVVGAMTSGLGRLADAFLAARNAGSAMKAIPAFLRGLGINPLGLAIAGVAAGVGLLAIKLASAKTDADRFAESLRGIRAAASELEDAQLSERQARLNVTEADQRVRDVSAELAAARKRGASKKELITLERTLEQARIDSARAQLDLTAAEEARAEAQRKSTETRSKTLTGISKQLGNTFARGTANVGGREIIPGLKQLGDETSQISQRVATLARRYIEAGGSVDDFVKGLKDVPPEISTRVQIIAEGEQTEAIQEELRQLAEPKLLRLRTKVEDAASLKELNTTLAGIEDLDLRKLLRVAIRGKDLEEARALLLELSDPKVVSIKASTREATKAVRDLGAEILGKIPAKVETQIIQKLAGVINGQETDFRKVEERLNSIKNLDPTIRKEILAKLKADLQAAVKVRVPIIDYRALQGETGIARGILSLSPTVRSYQEFHRGGRVQGQPGEDVVTVLKPRERVLTESTDTQLAQLLAETRQTNQAIIAALSRMSTTTTTPIGPLRGRLRIEGSDAYIDARVESLFEAERKHRSRVRSMG